MPVRREGTASDGPQRLLCCVCINRRAQYIRHTCVPPQGYLKHWNLNGLHYTKSSAHSSSLQIDSLLRSSPLTSRTVAPSLLRGDLACRSLLSNWAYLKPQFHPQLFAHTTFLMPTVKGPKTKRGVTYRLKGVYVETHRGK